MTSTTETREIDIVAALQRLEPIVKAHRDEGEEARRLSAPVFEALKETSVLGLLVPREYGGGEAGLVPYMTVVERLARLDGATGWTYANLAGCASLTASVPSTGALGIFEGRADFVMAGTIAPRGRAVPVEGGFRLNGRWHLVSGAWHADWIGLSAIIFDGDSPRMTPQGPAISIFIAQAAGLQLIDTWQSVGLRGTGSIDVAAADVFVPSDRGFPIFGGAPFVAGPLYRAGAMTIFGLGISSVMLGIAREAIDAFVELARDKTPAMSQTGLASRPTVHAEVAKAEAMLQSARAYLFQTAREITDELEGGGAINDSLETKRRLACVNAGQSARTVVEAMYTLSGSTPIYTGNRIERCMRDIHTAAQHFFASPAWWEKTGQAYFGLGLGAL